MHIAGVDPAAVLVRWSHHELARGERRLRPTLAGSASDGEAIHAAPVAPHAEQDDQSDEEDPYDDGVDTFCVSTDRDTEFNTLTDTRLKHFLKQENLQKSLILI